MSGACCLTMAGSRAGQQSRPCQWSTQNATENSWVASCQALCREWEIASSVRPSDHAILVFSDQDLPSGNYSSLWALLTPGNLRGYEKTRRSGRTDIYPNATCIHVQPCPREVISLYWLASVAFSFEADGKSVACVEVRRSREVGCGISPTTATANMFEVETGVHIYKAYQSDAVQELVSISTRSRVVSIFKYSPNLSPHRTAALQVSSYLVIDDGRSTRKPGIGIVDGSRCGNECSALSAPALQTPRSARSVRPLWRAPRPSGAFQAGPAP
ncbi:hypothetical protein DFH06DRAFT_717051 [Mycena polygramma]|nr:hypothetical protein DFH06DRAFT_717051 [Mycena polygramma]